MLTAVEIALLGLAAYRVTRLVVLDTIADAPRDAVVSWLLRKHTYVRHMAVTLISCIFCAGWWVTGAVLAAWTAATGGGWGNPVTYLVSWFAVAGVAALAGAADDALQGGES